MLRTTLKVLLAVLLLVGAGKLIRGQTAGEKLPAFDVISVKPSASDVQAKTIFPLGPGDVYVKNGGHFAADGFPLATYLYFAYKVLGNQMDAVVAQLPNWALNDRFFIEARTDGDPAKDTKDQMRLMMQALLADRFQLKAHFESREVPVFELRLAKPGKLGPKLIPHADGPPCDRPGASPADDVPSFHFVCRTFSPYLDLGTKMVLGARDVGMDAMAGAMSQAFGGPMAFGRPIIDKTGLTGRFDFTVEWANERRRSPGSDSPVASDPSGPTPIEALRDQLGLKLESRKAVIPILVIDKVERPSEN
jgi:uncharacterized protein (TIGR03435 family)